VLQSGDDCQCNACRVPACKTAQYRDRCQTSAHIVCIEYDWRQAASEAAAKEDEREHVVMYHTAARRLHLELTPVDVEWILYSRHKDSYSSLTQRVSAFKPKYAWCCHQGTGEVNVFGACEINPFSHAVWRYHPLSECHRGEHPGSLQ